MHVKGVAMKKPAGREKSYAVVLFFISLVWVLTMAACAAQTNTAQFLPLLPPEYYQCYETTSQDIITAYFGAYSSRPLAEALYNNQPFVFKNIEIMPGMMESQGPDYIWVDRTQCMAVNPTDVAKLKVGQVVDVVGIMRGVSIDPDKRMDLLMTDCYFLPAGSFALPVPGGPVMATGY